MKRIATVLFATFLMTAGLSASVSAQSVPDAFRDFDRAMEQSMAAFGEAMDNSMAAFGEAMDDSMAEVDRAMTNFARDFDREFDRAWRAPQHRGPDRRAHRDRHDRRDRRERRNAWDAYGYGYGDWYGYHDDDAYDFDDRGYDFDDSGTGTDNYDTSFDNYGTDNHGDGFDNYGYDFDDSGYGYDSRGNDGYGSGRQNTQSGQDSVFDHKHGISIYSFLTAEEKRLYDTLYPSLANGSASATIFTDEDSDTVQNVLRSIRFDHPELFWIKSSFQYTTSGRRMEITFQYNDLVNDRARLQAEFHRKAQEVLSVARQKRTKLEQEKYVYEYLITNSVYKKHDLSWNAYYALVKGSAVCEGFALAFHYLLQQLDIPSYVVSDVNHAWVVAQIDGRWVAVDPTTPQNTSYRLDSRAKIDSFEKKNFNVEYNKFSHSPDVREFPNDRLFAK